MVYWKIPVKCLHAPCLLLPRQHRTSSHQNNSNQNLLIPAGFSLQEHCGYFWTARSLVAIIYSFAANVRTVRISRRNAAVTSLRMLLRAMLLMLTSFPRVVVTASGRIRLLSAMSNPKCFFDITIGGKAAGRIVMELRADVVPKTAGQCMRTHQKWGMREGWSYVIGPLAARRCDLASRRRLKSFYCFRTVAGCLCVRARSAVVRLPSRSVVGVGRKRRGAIPGGGG